MTTYRVRCNKRECQARRTICKHPSEYRHRPKCHRPGCDGEMYIDKFRQEGKEKTVIPVCNDDCYHFPHSMLSKNCKHRPDNVIDASFKRSKHNPNRNHEVLDECPF